jgi:riboflavin kinase/FMN adenylyltransferase
LLGRPYHISGVVEHGDHRGRELGFPTANLRTEAELLPPNGVYAVWVSLGSRQLPGVANLGTKPSFSGSRYCIEAHLFDFHEDIYHAPMQISFVEWLREERKFIDIQGLIRQIDMDALRARDILTDSTPPKQNL